MIFHTIKNRLLFYSFILAIVIILTISLVASNRSSQLVLAERISVVTLEVEAEKVFIEREFSKLYENAQALSIIVEQLIIDDNQVESRDFILEYSENIINENPNITGIRFVLEKDALHDDADYVGEENYQYDGQFITYIGETANGISAEYIDNYAELEFYTRAISEKVNFFTEPFKSEINVSDAYLVTVVFPLIINGEYMGLIGIDFSSELILSKMQTFQESFHRRDLLISQSGTILINTENQADSGKNITEVHSNISEQIGEVETDFQLEADGHLEIIYAVDLGSSGENWYIFSDIDQTVLTADITQNRLITLYVGIALLLVYIVVIYITNSKVLSPLTSLGIIIQDFDIEKDNIDTVDFNSRNLNDINNLFVAYKDSVILVQENIANQQKQSLIQETKLEMTSNLGNAEKLGQMSDKILSSIIDHTSVIVGGLYVMHDDVLKRESNFGLQDSLKTTYKIGEGIIGLAAKTKKVELLDKENVNIPIIEVEKKQVNPTHLIAYPVLADTEVIAVLFLACIDDIENTMEYLNTIHPVIGSNINRQITSSKLTELYDKSQKLSADLNNRNEELQSQQEELRVTNEELQSQQEELRVTNEELQENMRQVDKMNKSLEIARKELEVRTKEAEESNKFKSEFLGNMSHELRTPLNSILILSKLIEESTTTTTKANEYAQTINSAGKDLLELINSILDLTKVESGKEEVIVNDLVLNDLVEDLNKRYSVIANDKNINFDIDIPQNEILLKTDISKIKLILTNLISNALKFTEEGYVKLKVIENTSEVLIEVEDTGIGIKSEDLESIFEEFKQLDSDNNRKYAGTGLGLSICKRYSLLLKGRLNVESTFNKGTKFILVLPKNAFESKNKEITKIKKRVEDDGLVVDDRHTLSDNEVSILIIDDDERLLKSYRDFFNSKGIPIIVTDTGENGLFLADYYQPSLIIIDFNLPRVNGEEVIAKLKHNDHTKDIPFILISGDDLVDKYKEFEVYQKPVQEKQLEKIVNRVKKLLNVKKRILVVEDDKVQQNAIIEYIKSKKTSINLIIDTAESGKETLQKLDEKLYSLIVLDLGLTDTKNFELVDKIKTNKQHVNIPIIVYTGKEINNEQEKYLSERVDDIIIKGIKSPQRLISDIQLYVKSSDSKSTITDKKLFEDRKVLIIDDDIRNIYALNGLLERYNIDIVYDTSGISALERLKKEKDIDLILTDIMMPELDGYETTKRIRKMSNYADTPIIALTAKTMRGDREKCIQAGATEYLSKPIDESKLLSVLRVWL